MTTRLGSLFRRDPADVQGAYFLLTGLWPLLHLRSFSRVTGPKPEGWLVKTVGGLVSAIGVTLLSARRHGRVTPELRQLAITSALSLLIIDVYYAGKRRLSPVYLGDAVLEAALVAAQWRARADVPVKVLPRRRPPPPSLSGAGVHGRWDILPGESRDMSGRLDKVAEGSMASFPASDPPSFMG
ncbi:hypothetical protein D7W79_39155 [Corallococcus exercitus]|uniref:Uncharacterized protein n=1 Tax=Corallococcus exercitus TaxID=2316736 RepID=A0A3A8H0I3_9BACT|nr:hypothetical protein [Corallococcus exercitus]NOK31960.1 hypothetical protein [Corallococcus exercitus]RKG64365.1 hypothetical protein D7W79_39155 [Corallococcus exercitus]